MRRMGLMEVSIRNKQFLKTLDSIIDDFYTGPEYDAERHAVFSSQEDRSRGEYYCSKEWLDICLSGDPIGPPQNHYAHPVGKRRRESQYWENYVERVKYEFPKEIGAHTSALLSWYPPGGFVAWHTNWDATAYQILFTWSKDGNGYFRYLDNATGEIVTIQDKPGWQCRWYYFGRKDEPENICWHSAYCGSERMTLAYKFVSSARGPNNSYVEDAEKRRQAENLRDMLIEEIEND